MLHIACCTLHAAHCTVLAQLDFEPGTKQAYCSTNYILLGLVLAQHLSADSWEQYAPSMTGLTPSTPAPGPGSPHVPSAPGPGSLCPHLHQRLARSCYMPTGPRLVSPTSAPVLGPATAAPGLSSPPATFEEWRRPQHYILSAPRQRTPGITQHATLNMQHETARPTGGED
jgi:hypothetical protein